METGDPGIPVVPPDMIRYQILPEYELLGRTSHSSSILPSTVETGEPGVPVVPPDMIRYQILPEYELLGRTSHSSSILPSTVGQVTPVSLWSLLI